MSQKVNYSDFLETVLDFQLSEHEKFLTKFMELFKKFDTDNDGILSSSQFVNLYKSMNLNTLSTDDKFNVEINNFLDILDPYQCDKVILSDIV
jgi:Ca2+-binding EF-hand superfamily protein